MQRDYLIHLNFLPIKGDLPICSLYRRRCSSAQESRPCVDAQLYQLPTSATDNERRQAFWVTLEETKGFDVFEFNPSCNLGLSRRLLFESFKKAVQRLLSPEQYRVPANEFIEEIALVMETHPEGYELLVVQAYCFRVAHQIGFLVDFHFGLRHGMAFDRRVQQLSLSLNRNFRRNADHHIDRSAKIRRFLERHWNVFSAIRLPGTSRPLSMSNEFGALPAERLRPKTYVFSDGRESRSQFAGLRDFGPLQPVPGSTRLLFAFREQDRQAARRLAVALKGLKQQGNYTFPGFKRLFKTDIEIDRQPIILSDLTAQTMGIALRRAMSERQNVSQLVPVVVLPSGEDNGYFELKALFSNSGLSTQVCTLKILEDEELLKWAIANLALQIFCKAGGQPWKVRPTPEKSLIVGISQSHKTRFIDGRPTIDRYFAFSVLTDSSGLFQKIQVLGEAADSSTYISELRTNLKKLLEENAGLFRRVVIHTSFKLKHSEMDAIQRTTQEVATVTAERCKFVVIKVNHRNRFFGINRSVNSLVPYEGTKVRLGRHEYLVWFEGLLPEHPSVTRAFPGPTHLQFLRMNEEATIAEEGQILQDIVNLSGANWRGFNAKSAPISVFYCHLVADFVRDFHDRGLPLPAVEDIRPWFL